MAARVKSEITLLPRVAVMNRTFIKRVQVPSDRVAVLAANLVIAIVAVVHAVEVASPQLPLQAGLDASLDPEHVRAHLGASLGPEALRVRLGASLHLKVLRALLGTSLLGLTQAWIPILCVRLGARRHLGAHLGASLHLRVVRDRLGTALNVAYID